jgi:hypothetical protein
MARADSKKTAAVPGPADDGSLPPLRSLKKARGYNVFDNGWWAKGRFRWTKRPFLPSILLSSATLATERFIAKTLCGFYARTS